MLTSLLNAAIGNKFYNSKKRHRKTSKESYPEYKKLKTSESTINTSETVVEMLQFNLKNIIIDNKILFNTTIDDIQPYGSRISGIYTDDSDVDFHISYTSKLPVKKVVRLFAKSLHSTNIFIKVIPIVYAKIPIIKCIHKKTNINCDISFNNISAVYNSHLLNYIINMDHRIKPVLMKLKTWAKHIGLICTHGFSSYSFYWLGLFCLQHIGILPSIQELQKSIPELVVGHWNCAFAIGQQKCIHQKEVPLSENEILNLFYEYYSSFDYETYIISPYTGYPLLKIHFENIEQLPEELWRYKKFYKEHKEQPKTLFFF